MKQDKRKFKPGDVVHSCVSNLDAVIMWVGEECPGMSSVFWIQQNRFPYDREYPIRYLNGTFHGCHAAWAHVETLTLVQPPKKKKIEQLTFDFEEGK